MEERIMPITPFLAGQAFGPEIIQTMSTAFLAVRERLGLTDRTDKMTETVAATIMPTLDPTAIAIMMAMAAVVVFIALHGRGRWY
jgi:hypothetical protein